MRRQDTAFAQGWALASATRAMVMVAALLVLTSAGCHRPLAVPNPLATLPGGQLTEVTVGGMTVIGNNGHALNAATRIHRELLERKIANQVRCEVSVGGRDDKAVRTRIDVSFPQELDEAQRRAVEEVFATLSGPGA